MKVHLASIVKRIDRLTTASGRVIAPLLGLMLVATFAVVVLRYGFSAGTQAIQEFVVYLHATVFMLGFAYTLKADGHVRVDILYQKMTERQKAMVNFVGTLLLLVPMSAFILYSSFDYVQFSWQLKEGSPEPGGLPYVYLMKSLIPLSAALLLIQGIAESLRNLLMLLGADHG